MCRTAGCTRQTIPEWAYCRACADKLIANALRQPLVREPEWVRRMKANRGVTKDYTAA